MLILGPVPYQSDFYTAVCAANGKSPTEFYRKRSLIQCANMSDLWSRIIDDVSFPNDKIVAFTNGN